MNEPNNNESLGSDLISIEQAAEELPWGIGKIRKLTKAGIFKIVNDPLTGKPPSRGQVTYLKRSQIKDVIDNL